MLLLTRFVAVLSTLGFLAGVTDAQEPKPAKAGPEQALVEALSGGTPFLRGEYKAVRAAFAKHFEQTHPDEIKAAYADDHDAITKWLDANPDIKETFYTAIDPESDQVTRALEIFRDLYKLGPDRLKAYPALAVALAVTWDDKKAVYDYTGHQRRTRSVLPDGVKDVDYVDNYEYFTKAEGPLKNAVQNLPWEFLVHVVNHQTPDDERAWAVKHYLPRRVGIGASYKDIQYDHEMLRTEVANGVGKAECRLTGEPYTLESIRKRGGVCAMQADFAARVGKSLAVPAEYVGGESNSGGRHAWVMWVEVRSIARDRIDFALVSEGRYLGDQYYVGELKDPKTGQKMTDRDMERRLTFVGQAPQNARQADLLMRAFPIVRDTKNLTTLQQLDYLRKVRDVFPSAERAWLVTAELTRDGKVTDPLNAGRTADQALTIFAKFPDFSWRIIDDLLTPVKDKGTRSRLYERLVTGYEGLGRPDLACEARLKLVEYQVEAKEWQRAANGLAQTVRKFPDEGRYVPKMMEKLQEVCGAKEYRGGVDLLTRFYLEILPKVPKKRGSEVSKYCVEMHEQALAFLKTHSKYREAVFVEQQLAALKR